MSILRASAVLFVMVTQSAAAGTLDPASAEALEQTQTLLKDRARRAQAVQGDPSARAADAQAKALEANGISPDAIYGLSSEIFADLTRESGGDPIKMQELLQQAQKDPEGFAKRLSQKHQRAIRELSGKAVNVPSSPK